MNSGTKNSVDETGDDSLRLEDTSKSTDMDRSETIHAPADDEDVQQLLMSAKKDSEKVNLWRIILAVVLVAVALTVTLVAYFFLKNDQEKNVQTTFGEYAATISQAAKDSFKQIRDEYATFANTLTAYAESTDGVEWPFVTLPLFESYGRSIIPQTRTEIFQIYPRVTQENVKKYLNYTTAGYQDWIAESHRIQGDDTRLDPVNYHPYISKVVKGEIVPDETGRDVYFPSWQFSPPPISYGVLNWNVYSSPTAAVSIDAMLRLNRPVMSEVRFYSISPGVAFTDEEHEQMHSELPDSDVDHPHAFMRQPIRASVEDPNSEIVAFLATGMALDAPLQDLLPSNVGGIMAVVSNSCDQYWTWEINGREAKFLGDGDLHETKYDDWKVFADLSLYTDEEYVEDGGHCRYFMSLYPSTKFVEQVETNIAAIYAVIVSMTFLVVFAVFIVYDVFVRKRNKT